MTKMLSFLQVEKNSVLEAWKDISCTTFHQKEYFCNIFSFFVNVVLRLGVNWPYKSRDPNNKALVLIFKERNIGISLVVNLH